MWCGDGMQGLGNSGHWLIWRIGGIGDAVVSLPAARAFVKNYSASRIDLLTNGSMSTPGLVESVWQSELPICKVILYGPENPFPLVHLKKIAHKISGVFYALEYRGVSRTLRDFLFLKAIGFRKIVGMPWLDCIRGSKNQEYVEHEADRLLKRAGGGQCDIKLNLTQDERYAMQRILGEGSSPILAISVGTKDVVKNWGESNWIELLKILKNMGFKGTLLFVGGSGDVALSEQLGQIWGDMYINACGLVSPRVCSAILGKASLMLCHDSGPMHLAASAGTPCIAIFSSRDVAGRWWPIGDHHEVIYKQVSCSGCRLATCVKEKMKCILSITPGEVAEIVAQKWIKS